MKKITLELTDKEIEALLSVIGESYPIQRKRSGCWEKTIETAIVSAREKLEDYGAQVVRTAQNKNDWNE